MYGDDDIRSRFLLSPCALTLVVCDRYIGGPVLFAIRGIVFGLCFNNEPGLGFGSLNSL